MTIEHKNFMTQNLHQLRINLDITQVELAEMIDVSRTTISEYESGNRSISKKNLLKLSNLVGVTPEEFRNKPLNKLEINEPAATYSATRDNVISISNYGYTESGEGRQKIQYWPFLPRSAPSGDKWVKMRVTGDSMKGVVEAGDILFADIMSMSEFQDDNIIIIGFQDGSHTVKRVRKIRNEKDENYGCYELISSNSMYGSQIVSEEEIKQFYKIHVKVGMDWWV